MPEPGRDYTRKGLTGLRTNDQEEWFTDPRNPAARQLPDRFFTKDRAAFDKGHIVDARTSRGGTHTTRCGVPTGTPST